VIVLREVSKRFGDRVALDDVSIDVRPGTVHVLLGSSGSGKSTVLRVILGLVKPDRGEVAVDGTPVTDTTRASLVRRMGYVVQDGGLYPHLTAFDNVALPADVHGWYSRTQWVDAHEGGPSEFMHAPRSKNLRVLDGRTWDEYPQADQHRRPR